MNTNILIRMATEADAEEILKIYAPYITDTAITFEYDIPSVHPDMPDPIVPITNIRGLGTEVDA